MGTPQSELPCRLSLRKRRRFSIPRLTRPSHACLPIVAKIWWIWWPCRIFIGNIHQIKNWRLTHFFTGFRRGLVVEVWRGGPSEEAMVLNLANGRCEVLGDLYGQVHRRLTGKDNLNKKVNYFCWLHWRATAGRFQGLNPQVPRIQPTYCHPISGPGPALVYYLICIGTFRARLGASCKARYLGPSNSHHTADFTYIKIPYTQFG